MDLFSAIGIVLGQPDVWMPHLMRHLHMSAMAMAIALMIAIPVGAWLTRIERAAFAVVSVANLGRTIPSLAILALIYPFVGTGFTPSVIALVALAIPPILLQTYTAVREVPADVSDAAQGMGMQDRQRLLVAELPLAAPLMLSGIRTAGVQVVASATLAALIGGGGLGEMVLAGLSNMQVDLLLAGAILVALLAALVEVTVTLVERYVLPAGVRFAAQAGASGSSRYRAGDALSPRHWATVGGGAAAAAVALVLVGTWVTDTVSSGNVYAGERPDLPRVVVGSKDTPEQQVIAELYAQALEAQGFAVERATPAASTEDADASVRSGSFDLYPEYTGTAHTVIHGNRHRPGSDPVEVRSLIAAGYEDAGVTILPAAGSDSGNALVVRRELAEQHDIEAISDLRRGAHRLRLAAPRQFLDSRTGMAKLQDAYDISFRRVLPTARGSTYRALRQGRAEVAFGVLSDPELANEDLVVLVDDRRAWPQYAPMPVVRTELLEQAGPALQATLGSVSRALDGAAMRQLNAMVADGTGPAEAARTLLDGAGLLDVGARPELTIGSKDFTEQLVLGELYAQALATRGFTVRTRLNLGATGVVDAALERGDVDLYPEYTGTSYTAVFKQSVQPDDDRYSIARSVAHSYAERDMTMLEPTPFSNGFAVVVTEEMAAEHGLETIGDLAGIAPDIDLAGMPGFEQREDGLGLLAESYGTDFQSFKTFEIGLKYKALLDGLVGATVGFETDGHIARYNLVVLADDKEIWPPYQAAPILGSRLGEVADADLASTINAVTRLLDTETMQDLNNRVDQDKRRPSEVAREFLEAHHLVYPGTEGP